MSLSKVKSFSKGFFKCISIVDLVLLPLSISKWNTSLLTLPLIKVSSLVVSLSFISKLAKVRLLFSLYSNKFILSFNKSWITSTILFNFAISSSLNLSYADNSSLYILLLFLFLANLSYLVSIFSTT